TCKERTITLEVFQQNMVALGTMPRVRVFFMVKETPRTLTSRCPLVLFLKALSTHRRWRGRITYLTKGGRTVGRIERGVSLRSLGQSHPLDEAMSNQNSVQGLRNFIPGTIQEVPPMDS